MVPRSAPAGRNGVIGPTPTTARASMPHAAGGGRSPLRLARQPYRELAVVADLAVHGDVAAMLLRDDVVGDRQAETGAFAGRLGGEERLEQLVPDVGRYAGAVVPHA